jgi:hypothetical protein
MMSSPEIFQNDDPRGPSPPARIPRQQWELWCVAALLVYFLVRLLYFAVNIAPEIPPDESTHLGIIRLYAETPLLIDNSPESYRFGLVTRQPSLYYFLLGKLAAINFFGMNDVLYLRLINVVLAMLTVVVGYRIASRLTDDSLIRLVYLVVVTNTPSSVLPLATTISSTCSPRSRSTASCASCWKTNPRTCCSLDFGSPSAC